MLWRRIIYGLIIPYLSLFEIKLHLSKRINSRCLQFRSIFSYTEIREFSTQNFHAKRKSQGKILKKTSILDVEIQRKSQKSLKKLFSRQKEEENQEYHEEMQRR